MIKAMRKVCNVRLDSNRPYKAAALCPVTVAALMSTLSVTNAGDVTFAAVLALGLAFWMRPNEWFFLDVECLAFVEMQGIELLHILFVISKADEFSSGVVRRTAHRLGCGGTSTAPEIVLDGDGRFHGAFMCPVCYVAYHLRFNELATGPAFRARSDSSAPMPMDQVSKELRGKIGVMNEARSKIGSRPLQKFEVSARCLRTTSATFAEQDLGITQTMAKYQARWARGTSGDKIHGDYVRHEDASGQALMKSVGSTFGVASRGNKVMQWMLAKEQANEEPTFQDAATFDLSRTLPTAGGFPATRLLSDLDVRRHLETQGVDVARLDDAAQATNATLLFAMKTDFGDAEEAEKQLRAERDAAEATSTSAAASGTPGPSTLGLAEVGESAAGADDGSATAASAAAVRLREREASYEFTSEGVFAAGAQLWHRSLGRGICS